MKTRKREKSFFVSIVLFLVALNAVILESCSQKMSQTQSPTAPAASEESKGNPKQKKDVVEGVKPMIQYFSEGYIYNGGTEWFLVNYVPANLHNGTYTMFSTANVSSDKFATMFSYYGFRRAVCGSGDISALHQAQFDYGQLIITLPNGGTDECGPIGGLASGWQTIISTYSNSVLGYFIDEPSGNLTGSDMQTVATQVHGAQSQLWLDDYDTGVISSILYFAFHNCHLADGVMLHYGDHIMCDADNAAATNGWDGIGCYIGEDYNEFQSWFGSTFNSIWTINGFPNEGSLVNWMESQSNISNYAIYLTSSWSWGDIDNFAGYAYQAGFLGQYQVLKQAQYVCQANNVGFSPGSGGIAGSYYGVWNGSYYTGPVDPNTQGATLCWMLQTWVSLNQYQTVFGR